MNRSLARGISAAVLAVAAIVALGGCGASPTPQSADVAKEAALNGASEMCIRILGPDPIHVTWVKYSSVTTDADVVLSRDVSQTCARGSNTGEALLYRNGEKEQTRSPYDLAVSISGGGKTEMLTVERFERVESVYFWNDLSEETLFHKDEQSTGRNLYVYRYVGGGNLIGNNEPFSTWNSPLYMSTVLEPSGKWNIFAGVL